MKNSFYSIGHANRNILEFINLLTHNGVTLLADIRSVPKSRNNPDFNNDALPNTLKTFGIAYVHIAELGGFRALSKTVPLHINAFWQHNSFHSYADYALSDEFQNGLKKLIEFSKKHVIAYMCAEMLWWRCHRRIVTDYLLVNNANVSHIIAENNIKPATLTKEAIISNDKLITYPLL